MKQEQQNLEKESNLQQQQQAQQLHHHGVDIPDGKTQSRPDGRRSFLKVTSLCLFCLFLSNINI